MKRSVKIPSWPKSCRRRRALGKRLRAGPVALRDGRERELWDRYLRLHRAMAFLLPPLRWQWHGVRLCRCCCGSGGAAASLPQQLLPEPGQRLTLGRSLFLAVACS